MRSSIHVALFAGVVLAQNTPSAGAQSSATILNIYKDILQLSTLTVLGSDASATTYSNSCPPDATTDVSAIPSNQLTDNPRPTDNDFTLLPTDLTRIPVDSPTSTDNDFTLPTTDFTSILPIDTPAPRMRRQATASSGTASYCLPATLIQGPQTYELHITASGELSMDAECNWKGEMTTADLACTLSNSILGEQESVTTAIAQSDLRSEIKDPYQTVALVSATGSGAAAKSTGLAPASPLQTGAVLGSVVGIFAAALAL